VVDSLLPESASNGINRRLAGLRSDHEIERRRERNAASHIAQHVFPAALNCTYLAPGKTLPPPAGDDATVAATPGCLSAYLKIRNNHDKIMWRWC
jgi:hypothetical protein